MKARAGARKEETKNLEVVLRFEGVADCALASRHSTKPPFFIRFDNVLFFFVKRILKCGSFF